MGSPTRWRTLDEDASGKIGATGSDTINVTVLGRDKLVHDIDEHLEAIYRELDIQLKRLAQIQVQVDDLRAKVRALTEPPGLGTDRL